MSEPLAFGEFTLQRDDYLLTRRGMRVTLRPQAFRALRLLVERAGGLVTRGRSCVKRSGLDDVMSTSSTG